MTVHRSEPAPGTALITVVGDVDFANAAQITHAVTGAVADWAPAGVQVDLGGVPLIDSTGIAELIKSYRLAAGAGAGFAVVNPSPFLVGVFAVTGLLQVFGLPAVPAAESA
ncbi:MAG TPA: STAS domain-containing protein [Pilimelia sp.]|nr:STAS domain-containing protein [Pilimelia sp.]